MIFHQCIFCNRINDTVPIIVSSQIAKVCYKCIDNLHRQKSEELEKRNPKEPSVKLATPREIKSFLDDYVIDQQQAKKILSVAVYNHYKRLNSKEKIQPVQMPAENSLSNTNTLDDVEILKSNVLLIGPTGSGKTLLAQTLARFLDLPFVIADATSLTEAGYVGDDVESILGRLLQEADGDKEKAERGIIYIDEIDKISRKGESRSITRDVSGEGVQQALLKLVEGTVALVPGQMGRKHPSHEKIQIDTSEILFICGGAFEGLKEIIERRLNANSSQIGFHAKIGEKSKDDGLFENLEPDDLIRYGLIPELIGRLPVHVSLKELDQKSLIHVLTEPKNSITKQFIKMFNLEGCDLRFTEGALNEIANLAIKRKMGARGLRSIVENLLLDLMYNIPSHPAKEVLINSDVVLGKSSPIIITLKKRAAI